MLWLRNVLRTRTLSWFGHGCSGHRVIWEQERFHGLGMDFLGNTNVIMVFGMDALVTM